MWASQLSELNDGHSPRELDAAGADDEPESGVRVGGQAPTPRAEDEGALQPSPGVRHEDEEARAQGHLPWIGGPPRPRHPQVYGGQGVRVRGAPLRGHGDGGEGEPANESAPELQPIWAYGGEFGIL